jgi:hypothetical protein
MQTNGSFWQEIDACDPFAMTNSSVPARLELYQFRPDSVRNEVFHTSNAKEATSWVRHQRISSTIGHTNSDRLQGSPLGATPNFG